MEGLNWSFFNRDTSMIKIDEDERNTSMFVFNNIGDIIKKEEEMDDINTININMDMNLSCSYEESAEANNNEKTGHENINICVNTNTNTNKNKNPTTNINDKEKKKMIFKQKLAHTNKSIEAYLDGIKMNFINFIETKKTEININTNSMFTLLNVVPENMNMETEKHKLIDQKMNNMNTMLKELFQELSKFK